MQSIEIIDPPVNTSYDSEIIASVLRTEPTMAEHGGTFSGRPVTELFTDGKDIVKLRTEIRLDYPNAMDWVKRILKTERRLGIHHPDKIWFLLNDAEGKEPIIGNICPCLYPLDDLETLQSHFCDEDIVSFITLATNLYLKVAYRFDLSLDLDLSNFGYDENAILYYLDDDLYEWQNFQYLTEFLAGLVRSQQWLDAGLLDALAYGLRSNILRYFNDHGIVSDICKDLRSVFIPDSRKEQLDILIAGLSALRTGKNDEPHTSGAETIALLADIHANAPALESALNFLSRQHFDKLLVLGDVVGYGPHPNQCVAMLRALDDSMVIRGNHDNMVARREITHAVSNMALWTLNWTMQEVNEQSLQWLGELVTHIRGKDWLAVHGAPVDKTFFNAYVYHMSYDENLEELQRQGIPMCFHGHTHVPSVYYQQNGQNRVARLSHRIKLSEFQHSLICPGSVGQPRSRRPGVDLAIINTGSGELDFHHLDYDMATTLKDMRRFAFPATLLDRLSQGV